MSYDASQTIDSSSDTIDSREVISRIEFLSEKFADDDYRLDEDDAHELRLLLQLANQCDGVDDWDYGALLIRDSHFEEYAEELAEEIGSIPPGAGWPVCCIDWKAAAAELQMDYTSVTFDDVTYWVR